MAPLIANYIRNNSSVASLEDVMKSSIIKGLSQNITAFISSRIFHRLIIQLLNRPLKQLTVLLVPLLETPTHAWYLLNLFIKGNTQCNSSKNESNS
jgi:hypothetical protein